MEAITRVTFTPKELAQYIGIAKGTIYKMCRNKEIPYIDMNGKYLFRKEKIDLWLHNKEIENMQLIETNSQTEVKSLKEVEV